MTDDLEQFYQDAKAALKARDFDRASALLRQILLIDENFRDASRLLAQSVRLKRRKWYNDRRLWAAAGLMLLIGLGVLREPHLRHPYQDDVAPPTSSATTAAVAAPTGAETPAPTAVAMSWRRISIGQEFGRDLVTAFGVDPNDPDVLYVRMDHAGYFKSIDGGSSWQPTRRADVPADIRSGLTVYKKPAAPMQGAEEIPIVVAHVGLDGKQRLYKVGQSANRAEPSWFTSHDGGATWSWLEEIGKPKSAAVAFDAQGSVYVSCASHLCKYSADGKQEVTLGAPDVGAITIITTSPNDPNVIYVTGEGLSLSKDGGQTWTKLNNGLGSTMLQLDAGSGNTPILYVQSGECSDDQRNDNAGLPLYLSDDGGISWGLSLEAGCYLIKDADQTTMYRAGRCVDCAGSKGWIWRSSDEGRSWEKLASPGSAQALVADPLQAGTLYASMLVGYPAQATFVGLVSRQRLFHSEDHGLSWTIKSGAESLVRCSGFTPQSVDPNRPQFLDSNRPMTIDPRDGNHVLYVMNGVLIESHDSCIHDARLFNNPPTGRLNSIVFEPNHPTTLYAGTDQGAFVSFNDGQTWGQINEGLLGANVVYSIAVDKDSNVYATTPYGIFRLEGSE